MKWIEKLNESIDYIEDNLDKTIDYNEAAKIACCSTFHFERMFSYIAGVSLSEYIRRRRMTKAAFELQNSNIKILDLSIKYGYDSPTSFTRAFKSVHNISPSLSRREGVILKTYPKLVFSLSVKGDAELRYKIEQKPGIRIVGVRKKYGMDMEKNFVMVPKFWRSIKSNGTLSDICSLMNGEPRGILGVTSYQDLKCFYHYIAVSTDKPVKDGMVEYKIPSLTWAVFECSDVSAGSVQEIYRRFYTEWLPFSGYEYAETHDVEVYPEAGVKNNKAEVWFAIQKPNL